MPAPLAVILAGGFGTRIRHLLPETPKPLAQVAGRPFLDWILRYLKGQGLSSFVMSTGYLAGKVEQYARSAAISGVTLACVREDEPLGTAGGFVNALQGSGDKDSDALVLNGDSLMLVALQPLLGALDDPATDAAMLAVRVSDAQRYGALDVDDNAFLRGFAEKRPGAGLVNCGVYLFRRAMLGRFSDARPLSFEYDVFPALIHSGARVRVIPCEGAFLDIGTEQSLAEADAFVADNLRWFQ